MTLVRVGSAPQPFGAEAQFLDGVTPLPRTARLTIEEGAAPALLIDPEGLAPRRWPLAGLRRRRDQAVRDELVLHAEGAGPARLIVTDPEARRILAARCPLDRRPRATGTGRLLAWGAAAVLSVAVILTWLVPALADRLAGFLPPEGERVLGEATFEQVRSALARGGMELPLCENPDGRAALARMTGRLTEGLDLPAELEVHVLDVPMINAVALPGGIVVLFRGLIDTAEHPDEVAGVLAHEIGHVAARDPTRIALRTAGSVGVLGLLLGDFAGGTVVLLLTERMLRADYSRAAEAGADRFAHDLLARAGMRPSAVADLMGRFGDDDPEGAAALLEHFASHPATGDRIAAARAADAALAGPPVPSLDAEGWRALREICR
jgi:Zn-dependent protease with chaperone function